MRINLRPLTPRHLYWAMYVVAFPRYECELCIGQEPWSGCYCAYHGAYYPGGGDAPRWRRIARAAFLLLYREPGDRG